jgi:hypothetical protein
MAELSCHSGGKIGPLRKIKENIKNKLLKL